MQLFDAGTHEKIDAPIQALRTSITALTFSPDGRALAFTSNSNDVNGAGMIDIASRHVTAVDPPVPFALGATFRRDGKVLVVTIGVGGGVVFR